MLWHSCRFEFQHVSHSRVEREACFAVFEDVFYVTLHRDHTLLKHFHKDVIFGLIVDDVLNEPLSLLLIVDDIFEKESHLI